MKNFRTLAQAKKDMQVYLDYINLIEQYDPKNFVQHIIKEYALEGNLVRTAATLNHNKFLIENRVIEPHDITQAILSKPAPNDALHKEIRHLYMKKANIKRTTSKPFPYL